MSDIPVDYFKTKYNLRGRDWIRRIDPEDRQALTHLAFECSEYGKRGGRVRASKAARDSRGRFVKENK